MLNDKSEIVNNNGDCLIPRLTLLFLSSPLGRPPVSETRALTRFARSLRAHMRSRFDASVESSSCLKRRHRLNALTCVRAPALTFVRASMPLSRHHRGSGAATGLAFARCARMHTLSRHIRDNALRCLPR